MIMDYLKLKLCSLIPSSAQIPKTIVIITYIDLEVLRKVFYLCKQKHYSTDKH